MQEKPIIFSAPMVRAILEGRKTQTRRVNTCVDGANRFVRLDSDTAIFTDHILDIASPTISHEFKVRCPYGQHGDRLWVRETFGVQLEPCETYPRGYVIYKADLPAGEEDFQYEGGGSAWRPSIHMPRWASRITLEITEIRVKRVQDITETDAAAEGIEWDIADMAMVARDYGQKDAWFQSWDDTKPNYITENRIATASYRTLWDSINAKRGYSWASNPWVWAISFVVANHSSERTA